MKIAKVRNGTAIPKSFVVFAVCKFCKEHLPETVLAAHCCAVHPKEFHLIRLFLKGEKRDEYRTDRK